MFSRSAHSKSKALEQQLRIPKSFMLYERGIGTGRALTVNDFLRKLKGHLSTQTCSIDIIICIWAVAAEC